MRNDLFRPGAAPPKASPPAVVVVWSSWSPVLQSARPSSALALKQQQRACAAEGRLGDGRSRALVLPLSCPVRAGIGRRRPGVRRMHSALGADLRSRISNSSGSAPGGGRASKGGLAAGTAPNRIGAEARAEVEATPLEKALPNGCARLWAATATSGTRGACAVSADQAPRRARSIGARGSGIFNGVAQSASLFAFQSLRHATLQWWLMKGTCGDMLVRHIEGTSGYRKIGAPRNCNSEGKRALLRSDRRKLVYASFWPFFGVYYDFQEKRKS